VPFEVVVVDNGSHEPPEAVCASFRNVRMVIEKTPGPGPARSRGAVEARASIVAFIDADCLAQPGWIGDIALYFAAHPEAAVLAGNVGILRAQAERPTALELYEELYSYRVRLYVERDHYAATGNMAVRTKEFHRVGPFGGIATMEDRAWGRRAHQLGLRLDFVPRVRVLTPACRSFDELVRRWDRHIAHDFKEIATGWRGTIAWLWRSLAIAASPLLEAGRLALRPRGYGAADRLRALGVLTRIRLYRAAKMLALLGDNRSAQMVNSWNRN
jgi:glycosyltransferase involved in cell wall biosynthesis